MVGVGRSCVGREGVRLALETLPSEAKTIGYTETLACLVDLQKTDMVSRASTAVRGRVASAETIVHNMYRGIAPKQSPGLDAGFYSDVLSRVSHFFVDYKTQEDATGFSGKPGVDAYLARLQALTNEEAASVSDIEKLRAFTWLLSPVQTRGLQTLTKAAIKDADAIVKEDFPEKKRAKVSSSAASSKDDATKSSVMRNFM